MKKPFLTYAQQVDLLINDKGLSVSDRSEAIATLKQISYFALINGYKEPFKNADGKYKEGVDFRDILALYHFDADLSAILLRHLLSCERHLKSLYGYHFMQLYGDSEKDYLNPHNYDLTSPKLSAEVHDLVQEMRSLVQEESSPDYVNHYRNHYEEIPLWIILHAMTFGQLERLYWCSQPHLRDVICSEFPSVRSKNVTYLLLLLVHLRNTCAHSNPVYNVRFGRVHMPVTAAHHNLGLVEDDGKLSCGENDLFASLIAMKYILAPDEFSVMIDEIDSRLKKLFKSSGWLNEERLLPLMGFPENWHDIQSSQLQPQAQT